MFRKNIRSRLRGAAQRGDLKHVQMEVSSVCRLG